MMKQYRNRLLIPCNSAANGGLRVTGCALVLALRAGGPLPRATAHEACRMIAAPAHASGVLKQRAADQARPCSYSATSAAPIACDRSPRVAGTIWSWACCAGHRQGAADSRM